MVSLWGSKKADDRDEDSQEEDDLAETASTAGRRTPRARSSRRDPDERSALLPNPPPRMPRSDGYLHPDDPAVSIPSVRELHTNNASNEHQVSPYNLWSVRLLRYLTVVFAAITFIWWIILLVSIFVSPPGLYTRGSGFTDFAFTTLAFGNLVISLIFFTGPSLSLRISMAIVAIFLVIDAIIIVCVARERLEEGWIGIASVIWAALMAFWVVMVDRVVEWGKKEEEERLTGRPETRRTLKEWVAVLLATTITILYIVIAVLMTATLVIRAIDAGVELDGEKYYVDGDKYQVHLACVGNVTYGVDGKTPLPTILLESGEEPLEYDMEHWAYAAYINGTISRYCYWDRPGYAFSDNAPSPHSAGMSADVLSEALAVAGEQGPWIPVSAGYGSIVSRIFASRHIRDVVGLMMIDPLHEDLLHRIGSPTQGLTLWGYGVLSPLGVFRLIGAIFNGRTSEDRMYGRSVWQTGKFLKAKLQENLVANSLTKNEVVSARNIQALDTPLVIVSSGIESRRDEEWGRKQNDLTHLTDNLVAWDIVNKAPHQVWKTLDGRTLMEKRLGELVKAASK